MAKIITLSDFSNVVYGQYHAYNLRFFNEHFGEDYWTIPVSEFPHTKFLESLDEKGVENTDSFYYQFLNNAFERPGSLPNTKKIKLLKQKKFVEFLEEIRANPDMLLTLKRDNHACGSYRKDGKLAILHGNHRVAIAAYLGIPLKIKVQDDFKKNLKRYFDRHLEVNPKFFDGLKQPYQSIFDGEEEIAEGRRPDILERFKKINLEDIKGKRVLEFGCNVGASLYLALENEATYAFGIEMNPLTVNIALKLNTYFAKNINFLNVNLNNDFEIKEKFDTVFCLSIAGYVKDWDRLSKFILDTDLKVMYFEGHINKKIVDYVDLFKHFSKIEFLGYNKDQRKTDTYTRPFFRCIR